MAARSIGIASGLLGLAMTLACSHNRASCDVRTDQAAITAYKQATGKDHDARCIVHSSTFPGLVVMGTFADDRGCIGEGVLVGCQWNPKDAARQAMATSGWATADAAKKQMLALAWLSEITQTSVVASDPGGFAKVNKEWTPITATPGEDGSLTLELWERAPSGMLPINDYTRVKITFSANGTPGTAQVLDQAEVPMG